MSISLCLGSKTFTQVLMMQYIHLTKECGLRSNYEEYRHFVHERMVFY